MYFLNLIFNISVGFLVVATPLAMIYYARVRIRLRKFHISIYQKIGFLEKEYEDEAGSTTAFYDFIARNEYLDLCDSELNKLVRFYSLYGRVFFVSFIVLLITTVTLGLNGAPPALFN